MQRKTKLKIIFYSIGFISFALLPYIITTQDAETNQRFAPLPSYNNADASHPYLSRLGKFGNKLSSLFSKKPADQAAATSSDSSIEALNEAAAKEVLASLDASNSATTAASKAAAAKAAAAQAMGTAAAGAATAAEAAKEGAAQEGAAAGAEGAAAGQPFTGRAGALPYNSRFAGTDSLRQPLAQQGQAQQFAQVGNGLRRGAKTGSTFDDFLAENYATLVQNNPWRISGKAGKGNRSKSSQAKNSFKIRFQQAKNAFKQAAARRAAARKGQFTSRAVAAVSPAEIQREMDAMSNEMTDLWFAATGTDATAEPVQRRIEAEQTGPNALDIFSHPAVVQELAASYEKQVPSKKSSLSSDKQLNRGLLQYRGELPEDANTPPDGTVTPKNTETDPILTTFGNPELGSEFEPKFFEPEFKGDDPSQGVENTGQIPLAIVGDDANTDFIQKRLAELNNLAKDEKNQSPSAQEFIKACQDDLIELDKTYRELGCDQKQKCYFVAVPKNGIQTTEGKPLSEIVKDATDFKQVPINEPTSPQESWQVVGTDQLQDFVKKNPDAKVSCPGAATDSKCVGLVALLGRKNVTFTGDLTEITNSDQVAENLTQDAESGLTALDKIIKASNSAVASAAVNDQLKK